MVVVIAEYRHRPRAGAHPPYPGIEQRPPEWAHRFAQANLVEEQSGYYGNYVRIKTGDGPAVHSTTNHRPYT